MYLLVYFSSSDRNPFPFSYIEGILLQDQLGLEKTSVIYKVPS